MTEQRTSMIEVKDGDHDEVTGVGQVVEAEQTGYDNIVGNKIASDVERWNDYDDDFC